MKTFLKAIQQNQLRFALREQKMEEEREDKKQQTTTQSHIKPHTDTALSTAPPQKTGHKEVTETLNAPETTSLGLLLSHHGGRSAQNRQGGLESLSCSHRIILKLKHSLPSGKSV